MKTIKSIYLIVFLLVTGAVFAENKKPGALVRSTLKGLEYRIKAGVNIGGTSPLPLPAEIREINSYRPGAQLAIEGNIIKWFDRNRKWGGLFGIRLENKGMKTDARVKNYYMVMDSYDGEVLGHVEGNWTGNVKTNVKNSYITLPFQVIYKVSPRWDLKFGPYISILTNGDFSGVAYDGYIREEIRPVPKRMSRKQLTIFRATCVNFSGDWMPELNGGHINI